MAIKLDSWLEFLLDCLTGSEEGGEWGVGGGRWQMGGGKGEEEEHPSKAQR